MSLSVRIAERLSVRKRKAELEALRAIVAPAPEIRLLDLGGGAGAATERFANGCGEVVILEANAKKVAYGRRRRPSFRFLEGRAEAIPFPDGSFNRVTAVVAFHHMAEPDRVLAEIHRVLCPGGRIALIELPHSKSPGAFWRSWMARHREHLSFYAPDELAGRLKAHGFDDVVAKPGSHAFLVVGSRGLG